MYLKCHCERLNIETGFGMEELYLNTHCDNPNQGPMANISRLYGSTKSLIDIDISESHDTESSHPQHDTLYDNTSCELESERHISRLYGSTKSLTDIDISDSHDTECSHPPFDTLYDNTSFHVESESDISRLYGSCKSLIDVDITDSHDMECSHPQHYTLYDKTSFHFETESSTSRLYGSNNSLIDVDISDSHDTDCSHPQYDTLYDNKSFHVESENNTARLYGSVKNLIDVGITDTHDTKCSHPQHDTLYDNKNFHVESESNTAILYGSTKSLIDVGITDSHDTECSHPQHDTLYDNRSFFMERESNTSRLYGSTMHLIEIKISESCDTECSHPTFHTLYDNTSFHMETEKITTPDNNHKGHSARFSTHLLNTNHTEYSTNQSSMLYCDEINKGIVGEIICQKTNTMAAVPDDVVFKKSKQSVNNFQIAQSPGRNVVDCVEYDCNKVNISSGSEISNNNNRDFDPRTNNNVSETQTQSCLDDPPDGGWGWIVTFSAFMVGVILDGISFSFGLFFKELYVYFNESKSLTSWIISVFNGTYLGIGPIASVLVSIFGCRKVAIFGAILASIAFFLCTWSPNVRVMIVMYGLLGGIGLGLLYLPAIVSVGHYFKKKRALATGIAVCGSGVGGFVFAPLSEFLIETYTWKGAMWIISAICLNGVVIAALLRPLETGSIQKGRNDHEQDDEQNKESSKTSEPEKKICCDVSTMFEFSLLKSPTFLVYGCSCFLCMLGFYIPFTYLPDLAIDYGMTPQQSAHLISIIGIFNTVSRVMVGWIADRPWADALILNSMALVIGGVSTMFVPYYNSFSIMAMYSAVFGVAIAVFVSLWSIIVADLLGIEKLTSSFGLVTMCSGLSAFIGAPIAGALSDATGNYFGAFYLAGAAICLSGVICIPLRKISSWENRRKYQIDEDLNVLVVSSQHSHQLKDN